MLSAVGLIGSKTNYILNPRFYEAKVASGPITFEIVLYFLIEKA